MIQQNSLGAGDSPKGRTLNWKTLPPTTILKYFRKSGCTGMWKYASFRSMDVTQSPGDNAFRRDLVISSLNFSFLIKRFRGFRFVTGLRPPTFLAPKRGWTYWSELYARGPTLWGQELSPLSRPRRPGFHPHPVDGCSQVLRGQLSQVAFY